MSTDYETFVLGCYFGFAGSSKTIFASDVGIKLCATSGLVKYEPHVGKTDDGVDILSVDPSINIMCLKM